jgi:hypothetical protein
MSFSSNNKNKKRTYGEVSVSTATSGQPEPSYLANAEVLHPLASFLTTHELGRLLLQTSQEITSACGSSTAWLFLSESRWNRQHVAELVKYTGLSHRAIFRCFAYSDGEGNTPPTNPPAIPPATLPLPAAPFPPLPPLRYEPKDYVMVVEVRRDDDKLVFGQVLPWEEHAEIFREGETSFIPLAEPVWMASFPDPCEFNANGHRFYGVPDGVLPPNANGHRLYGIPDGVFPPLTVRVHLVRQDKYIELFYVSDCGWADMHLFYIAVDRIQGEQGEMMAVGCCYDCTRTARYYFPPVTDKILPLMHRLEWVGPTNEEGIQFWVDFKFNVQYPARPPTEVNPDQEAAAIDSTSAPSTTSIGTANITITDFCINGKWGDCNNKQVFSVENNGVEFAHVLEALDDWKNTE